VNELMIEFA
jgi:hypothetical protein